MCVCVCVCLYVYLHSVLIPGLDGAAGGQACPQRYS